jgi:hypothetical protein
LFFELHFVKGFVLAFFNFVMFTMTMSTSEA